MLMVTALALGLTWYRPPPKWTDVRHFRSSRWELRVRHDRFSGATSCSIRTKEVHFAKDTVIFGMGKDAETADAHFRIDAGPVHSVREALALNEARGYFPDRGWIEDASENEVAVPSTYIRGARIVWIRANSHVQPRYFRVAGLDYVLRAAAGLGCPISAAA